MGWLVYAIYSDVKSPLLADILMKRGSHKIITETPFRGGSYHVETWGAEADHEITELDAREGLLARSGSDRGSDDGRNARTCRRHPA